MLVNYLYGKLTLCRGIQHAVTLSIHYVPQVSGMLAQCTNWEVVPTLGLSSSQFLAVPSTPLLGVLRDESCRPLLSTVLLLWLNIDNSKGPGISPM